MKQDLIIKLFTLVLFVGANFVVANAETYETVINNGSPQNRIDIAILGDGYTAAQQAQYRSDVQRFIQDVFLQEPYREYQRYYNVHRVDVVSNQSGADHPERNPPFFVDTALDATYNCANIQRLICITTSKADQIINRSLPAGYFDVTLVIVNDPEYGGSGGSVAVASTNQQAVELILHEVAHSFGLLADEYDGGGPTCNPNIEPSVPNSTRQTSLSSIKWNHWIAAGTPIPTFTTTPAIPGLYEGSSYCTLGLYRPTFNSKMRSLGVPFEQINVEQHVKRVYNFVSPLDSSSPATNAVTLTSTQSQVFSVTTPLPLTHSLSVNWLIDGQTQASGASFTVNGSTLSPGSHVLQAVITDSTPFVRNDPSQLLSETRVWNLTVQSTAPRTVFDFDGDGRADVSVYRPSNGTWYMQNSTSGFSGAQFGASTDKIVPADYDSDGKTDLAVYRAGIWYLNRSQLGFTSVAFGVSDDIPVPADYDGDGKADVAVFRPSNGTWYLQRSQLGFVGVQFGQNGDKPVAADYDHDGKIDIAVFRAGMWFIQRSQLGFMSITFGTADDKSVPADYDGDGKADVAVFRPSSGTWYIQRSQAGFTGVQFGANGDSPTPSDYDGDGRADVAVFRNGTWYLNRSTQGFTGISFGAATDKPIPNAFNNGSF